MYSDYNYVIYYDDNYSKENEERGFLYERPILKSYKLANEFLAMQYAYFIDENDKVKLELFDNTEKNNDLLVELAEVSCMQFSNNPKALNADYYTIINDSKIIALNVEPKIRFIKLEVRDEVNKPIYKSSEVISFEGYNKDVSKLVFIISSGKQITNLSPIIHEFSNAPHNHIFDKIVTSKHLSQAMQMVVIENTFNNQAGISLGDELVDYETKITPSWSVYNNKLLINGGEVYG